MREPHIGNVLIVALGAAVLCAWGPAAPAAEPVFAFTADTEGHVWPGDCCGGLAGQGCLPRRATVVAAMRKATPEVLLLEAGNFLCGPGSIESKGKVMVVAYNLLGYDAANITYREFRFGKEQTLGLLKDAKFTPVSANLADEQSKELLFKPYIVKTAAGVKVAILGLTELPASVAKLPHVAQQMAGVTVRPPQEALAEWLPKAKAESDRVIVLYYGSLQGLKAVREKAGADVAAIFAGGMRPDELSDEGKPPVIATLEFGQQVSKVQWSGGVPKVAAMTVTAKVKIDEPTKKLLMPYMPASLLALQKASSGPTAATLPTAKALVTAEALRSGKVACNGETQSKGLVLKVRQIELLDAIGEVKPLLGGKLVALQTEWTNRLETAQEIPDLAAHLYMVANGRRLGMLHPQAAEIEGHLPERLQLAEASGVVKGLAVFDVPAADIQQLDLRYYDTTSGNLVMPLVQGKADSPNPVAGPAKNAALELAVYSLNKSPTWGDKKAPDGTAYAVIDLCGQSLSKADGRHADLADLPEWRKYTYLVVDGQYAHAVQAGGALPERLRLLPDATAGGEIAFLVPQKSESLELRMDCPSLDGKGKSAALVLALEGKRPAAAARKPIASIRDDMFQVEFVAQSVVASVSGKAAGEDHKLLVLDVSVTNTGKGGEWFQAHKQVQALAADDQKIEMDELTEQCTHPAAENVWVPAGERRSFQMVFQVPASDKKARVNFVGAKAEKAIPLGMLADKPAKSEGPAPTPTPDVVKPPEPSKPEPVASGTAPKPTPPPTPAVREGDTPSTTSAPSTQKGPRVLPSVKIGDTVVFDPSLKPKGLAGVKLTQAQVDAAVLKARKYLWEQIKGELDESKNWFSHRPNYLGALAMMHSGAVKDIPEFAGAVKATFQKTDDMDDTYLAGVVAMMVEASGSDEGRAAMALLTRYLVEAQGQKGTWSYGALEIDPIRKLFPKAPPAAAATGSPFKVQGGKPLSDAGAEVYRRKSPWKFGQDGDNSVTQFAVLGLWCASRSGLAIDGDIWKRCLAATRSFQNEDGSCGYSGQSDGYGSMTCAFICTSAITESLLGQDPFQDKGIHRAIAWLSQHWKVDGNPESSQHLYYYLYSLERVGRILDVDFIGDKEWYPLGARFLLDKQHADGGWGETEESNLEDTAFAVLFLTKATASLAPKAQGGNGTFVAAGPSIKADRVYFILDASNSMNEEIDGKSKFQIAQDSLTAIVKALPASAQVALRVYGNRMQEAAGGVDEDSTLEVPLGKLDKAAFAKKLQSVYARGKTPLAFSMEQAAEDLTKARASASSPVAVVLLTDGWESTAKNRDPIAAAKTLGAVEGALFNIVALDVSVEKEVKQLQEIAKAANGEYWAASKADKLTEHLRSSVLSLPGRYQVLDSAGKKVADGLFGQALTLKEGKYVFRTIVDGKPIEMPFWINTDQATRIEYQVPKPPAKSPRPTIPAEE